MKDFTTAFEESAEEDEGTPVPEQFIEFSINGREMKAYQPNEGQLIFMVANLGRGMNDMTRLAGIVNVLCSSLRGEDRDFFEGLLLESDPKKAIPTKTIEGIFSYVVEGWFGRPTQSPSGSAGSAPSGGQNS